MTEPHFVDSNVFVYRHDADEPEKQARAQEVLTALWRVRAGRISDQVLHELYVVVTRKLKKPLSIAAARTEVRQLETWRAVPVSVATRERAFDLEDRYSLSWWDALVVASALEAGCAFLLSEDLRDGLKVDGLKIVNPFVHALPSLGLAKP